MRPLYWLASYPKSGNTWFRLLIDNILSGSDDPVDINDIDSTETIASGRGRLDHFTMIDSGLLDHDDVDVLRHALYVHLAEPDSAPDPFDHRPARPIRLAKTHDGYTRNRDGSAMLGGAAAAAGAILLVRDPRDVAPSFANHMGCDIDKAVARMADPAFNFCDTPGYLFRQLRQQLLGWGGFYASWLDQRDIPVRLIRYEELSAAPHATLANALDFLGLPATAAQIDRAVAATTIDELQRQEAAKGFSEAPVGHRRFFRKGKAGGWREELRPEQAQRIEADHLAMMERLGYQPEAMLTASAGQRG